MIHRIESKYLHTQDSLNKREGQQRQRKQAPRISHRDPVPEHVEAPPRLEEERESVTLDLVA